MWRCISKINRLSIRVSGGQQIVFFNKVPEMKKAKEIRVG